LADWQVDSATMDALNQRGWSVFNTSAKDGSQVEALFGELVEKIVDS